MNESLGGSGGGSVSSSSRVDGSRILADEAVLRVLLLMEDCLVQTPSADIVLCVLERGEGPAPDCDLREATEDVREMAMDESRRVSGEGESSSSLHGRRYEYKGKEARVQDVHIPITPPQPGRETDTTAQEPTVSMPCSAFDGISVILEQAGLCLRGRLKLMSEIHPRKKGTGTAHRLTLHFQVWLTCQEP